MKARRLRIGLAILLSVVSPACGRGPSRSAINRSIRTLVTSALPTGTVAGERLLEPGAVARFYKERRSQMAWHHDDVPKFLEAIRGVYADGLDPDDYHLAVIEKLNERRKHETTAEAEANLDVLLSDALVAMADHIRYGRVHPRMLDPRWNVDPRDDMPPLEAMLAEVAKSHEPIPTLETYRPDHAIYLGLMNELARLRAIEAKGGWKKVPPGRAIKPGTIDSRVPRVRARLETSGELEPHALDGTSRRYDGALVAAVKRFQARHGLPETGVIDRKTTDAMDVSASARAGQVRVNMERARWVLNGLKGDFVLVNLPTFKAYYIRGGTSVWEGRTQIGDEAKQTPTFRARMKVVVFNPDWTVPHSIIAEEIFPEVHEGKDAIGSRHLRVYDEQGDEVDRGAIDWGSPDSFPYTLRQPPGPDNALGRVKLVFPNKYDIYLHDTPSKHLFQASRRTFSHGCIRTENVLQLAEILLQGQDGWSHEKIERTLADSVTVNVDLEHRPYVLIVYWTVTVGATGEVRYSVDIYNLDQPLLNALNGPPRAG